MGYAQRCSGKSVGQGWGTGRESSGEAFLCGFDEESGAIALTCDSVDAAQQIAGNHDVDAFGFQERWVEVYEEEDGVAALGIAGNLVEG